MGIEGMGMTIDEFFKKIDPDAGWHLSGVESGYIFDKNGMSPTCHVGYRMGLGRRLNHDANKVGWELGGYDNVDDFLNLRFASRYAPRYLPFEAWDYCRPQIEALTQAAYECCGAERG